MGDYVSKMLEEGKTFEDIVPLDFKNYNELLEKIKLEPPVQSVATPYEGLNAMTEGFDAGRLYVLGAPPKQGKTTLVTSMMYRLAKAGTKSLLFSYEVSWQEVTKNIRAMEEHDGVEPGSTDIPVFLPTELHRGGDKLQLQWLLEAIAKAKNDGIELIAIDHLHFLIPYQMTNNFSIVVGNVVREIKHLAVLFNIPIILIVPMKNLQSRRDPSFWDIRDSSMILHEADDVMIMYRLTVSRALKMSSINRHNSKQKLMPEDMSMAQVMMDDDDNDTKYSRVSVLSLELSRKSGASGKIYLWHNGGYFDEMPKDMVAQRVEEYEKQYGNK